MEPMDLCMRPNLCIVCKCRFWTTAELRQHVKLTHETGRANISHPRITGTGRNQYSPVSSSVPCNPIPSTQNASVSNNPGPSSPNAGVSNHPGPSSLIPSVSNHPGTSSKNASVSNLPGSSSQQANVASHSRPSSQHASVSNQPETSQAPDTTTFIPKRGFSEDKEGNSKKKRRRRETEV